jgi:hypothetical protein
MKVNSLNTRADGNTMLVVLMVVAILSAAVAGALQLTSSISRNVNRTNRHRDAMAVGDGALDYLFVHWHTKCRARSNNQLKGRDFEDIPMPTAELFPTVPNFVAVRKDYQPDTLPTEPISNLQIQGLTPTWDPIGIDEEVPPAAGMNVGARSYFYLASADVTLRNIAGRPMQVKARRIFEKEIGSPWMYAIFYTDRLEIHPGPEFHVTGWVHTNENLYTAHKSLWLESKVTYVGEWLPRVYAPGDGVHDPNDTNVVGDPHTNPDLPPRREDTQAPMGMDTPDFNTTDNNPNNDGYRELIERPSGIPDMSDPKQASIEDQRYYNQADVKILVDGNDASGKPIVTIKNHADETLSPSSTGIDAVIYSVFKDAVTVGDKIQDNREAAEVRLITLDMAKVKTAMSPPSGPLNGLLKGVIYVSDGTATSSSRRGVRLKNGGSMPPGGLTVVSDNPCYIQGDYNTGSNGTLQPDSNQPNGDPTRNTVPGYQKQSCAVVADAVQILSNSWNDANSYKAVDQRKATPTTVNTAIVSGIVPTGEYGSNYSGGAENFPRFMEKWGKDTTFTYHGSMVELYKSQQNIGKWGAGNVYDPPRRKWYFDRQFYTDPPPGTLSIIRYKRSRWFQE